MNDNKTLILSGTGYELLVAPEAQAAKAELIQHAALIVEVLDPNANQAASMQVKKLAAMRSLVEKSRTAVKAPVLQVGKDIDAKAAEFVAEIKAEETRIGKLMGDYAEAVERERVKILRELEAKRQAEAQAARAAETARLKAEQEATAARIAAEKAEWEAETPEQVAKSVAASAAAAAAAQEAERIAAAEAARREAETKVVEFVPAKVEGVKFAIDFEVTDINALYHYSPQLVTMEVKRREVLQLITQLGADGLSLPGLRIFKKPVVATR
jgi:hypothetical protein